jgi:hypothetical protein
MKLDMAKAYDRVEWDYLDGMMTKLGFHGDFITRVMRCVTYVSFCIRTNGVLSGCFRPTRGIFDMEIRFHLTYSDYAQRVYHVFFERLAQGICPGGYTWVFTLLGYHTRSLRMIALSLQKRRRGELVA